MKFTAIRKTAAILGIFLSMLYFAGCGSSAQEDGEKSAAKDSNVKIRLASQPTYFQVYVAEKLGYFKDEGLDVEISTFNYGPPIIEGMTSDNLDVGFMGDMPVYSGIANGLDIKIIASASASSDNQGIAVRDAAHIHQLSDLKGKKIAVPFGSNAQPFLYLLLAKGGLTEKDVEIVNLGPSDGVSSLVSGDIDADVIWEPNLSQAAETGNGVSVLQRGTGIKLFVSPILARNQFIKDNPEATAKLLKALQKAAEWSKANPDKAIEITHEATEATVPGLKILLDVGDLNLTLTQDKIDALDKGAKDSYKYGLLKKNVDIAKYIDTSILQKAGIQ
ncbi:ABC transporter substrate-binding protein [Pectinatus haikarae]|nr:aliphatic sulfonate ABC transporter substrate-binding protein [Pectinatus haikarae]